jgi:hypothetical protein
LKTDYENDLFYDSCQKVLIKSNNNYNHNRIKCKADFKFNDKMDEHEVKSVHSILRVLSNFYYLLSMGLLMSLLVPSFFMIFRYELLSNFISHFTKDNENERFQVQLDKEIKANREKVKRLILKNEKFKRNYQKEKARFKMMMQKCDEDFCRLEEKRHKKLDQFKSSHTNSDSQMKMFDMNGKLLITEAKNDAEINILLIEMNQLQNKSYIEFLELADENKAFTTCQTK